VYYVAGINNLTQQKLATTFSDGTPLPDRAAWEADKSGRRARPRRPFNVVRAPPELDSVAN
jgi:hypothetical protein